MNTPSRIREFRHLFSGPRRIVATVRIDMARVRIRPYALSYVQCEWDGSKGKQPSAELYQEYKEWMDIVLADLATKTGTNLLYLFEIPDPVKRIELWLYRPQRALRLVKTLPNPCQRPLSERIAGMPPANWDQD
jgi:hypothetical protein